MKRSAKPEKDEGALESERFLHRWSTRKAVARQVAETPTSVPVEKPAESEPVLTDADMPPLDSLTPDSDYRPFLSPGVSEELRRAALRRLFRSPAFNTLCPLEGEYFEAAGYTALGSIVTHEMRSQLAREAERLQTKTKEALKSAVSGDAKDRAATGATKKSQRTQNNPRTRPRKRRRRAQARTA